MKKLFVLIMMMALLATVALVTKADAQRSFHVSPVPGYQPYVPLRQRQPTSWQKPLAAPVPQWERDQDSMKKIERLLRGSESIRRQNRWESGQRNLHGADWNNCLYGRGDVNRCAR